MASAISFPTFSCSKHRKPPMISSSLVVSYSKISKYNRVSSVTNLVSSFLASWNGFSHLGISLRQSRCKQEKKGKWMSGVVYSSLFGVGAPEALVIGVVALLVFGPKGLAEVARNLGKTLRAFQPAIQELQDVSREFKSTLEREIGLDEVPPSINNTYNFGSPYMNENPQATVDQTGGTMTKRPSYSTEDYLRMTEEQLKESAAKQQTHTPILQQQQTLETPEIGSGSDPAAAPERGMMDKKNM